jgi:hypothetical protein
VLREYIIEIDQRLATLRGQGGRAVALAHYEREALRNRAYLRHLEAGLPHLPTDDELVTAIRTAPPATRLDRLAEVLVDRGFEGPGDLMTDRVRAGVREFVCFLVFTHPEALRIIESLVAVSILPPVIEGRDATVRSSATRIAGFVAAVHPNLTRRTLDSRIRHAIERARQTFDPSDEIPYENHAWSHMAEAAYEGAHTAPDLDGRAVAAAFQSAIDTSRILELDPSSDPPFQRLVEIVQKVVLTMFMSVAMVAKLEMDN